MLRNERALGDFIPRELLAGASGSEVGQGVGSDDGVCSGKGCGVRKRYGLYSGGSAGGASGFQVGQGVGGNDGVSGGKGGGVSKRKVARAPRGGGGQPFSPPCALPQNPLALRRIHRLACTALSPFKRDLKKRVLFLVCVIK